LIVYLTMSLPERTNKVPTRDLAGLDSAPSDRHATGSSHQLKIKKKKERRSTLLSPDTYFDGERAAAPQKGHRPRLPIAEASVSIPAFIHRDDEKLA
jgi:hypothetical protein